MLRQSPARGQFISFCRNGRKAQFVAISIVHFACGPRPRPSTDRLARPLRVGARSRWNGERMSLARSGLAPTAQADDISQVVAEITEQRWLALTRALVSAGQPAAENPLDPDMPPGREEGISEIVAAKLTDLGFAVDLVSKRAGRPNVIGTLAGSAPHGPTLILNDHLDTYPAGDPARWTKTGGDPFRPTRDGDFLYARGTSDTRGNLACTLLAVEAIRRAGITLSGTLKCVYTVDEE